MRRMPELPEAETIARQLARRLAGRRLRRVVHLRRDIVRHGASRVPAWLAGAAVTGVSRRGKRPVVHLAGDHGIIFFLGMTGYLGVHPSDQPSSAHTHLRIALDDGPEELRFSDARRFGGVSFFTARNGDTPLGLADLGIEPLAMTARQFRQAVTRRRQIKALLMDQGVIAGLGNIYCDESLHRAGIHPLELAVDVDATRLARLCRAIKAVLRESIRHEGTTIINYAHPEGPGDFQRRLRVYGHEDQGCRACGAPIVRQVIAGRATHFCPGCQPAP